jgi:SRSO17 transposase
VGRGAWARWIIVRRRPGEPQERDYFFAWGPEETLVEELVRVPGARWRAEDAIKLAKSACGLADYEVRSYHGWYRHITLAMLAAAFLAVQDARAAREREPAATPPAQRGGGRQSQL